MKLLLFLTMLMPFTLTAQTTDPYQKTMEKFKDFYNAGQGDSINAMFGHDLDKMKLTKSTWSDAKVTEYLKEYGKLKSFKFIGVDTEDPNEVRVFQSILSKKGTKLISLKLDSDNMVSIFRFVTSSGGTNRLLKNFSKSR